MGKNDMPALDVIRIKRYSLIQRCKSSEPSPASEQSCSSVCLRGHKWEEVAPLDTRNQHEEVFTGLMTLLPSPTPRYSLRLWASRFIKPWHSSQAGACKSPWEHDGHLSSYRRWVLCYAGCCHSCTLGSIAFMGLVIYGRVSCLIIQLALPSALYDS